MPHLIVESPANTPGSGAYRRLGTYQPMSRTERRELTALHNHAYRGQLEAIIAPPRLRRPDIRPLECRTLVQMLASEPAFDTRSVEIS